MNIGEYIKYLRQNKKLSLNQLALYSNVSNAHISRIENGKRKPSPDILKKLSIHLDVNYEDLLKKAGYLDDNTELISEKLKSLREEKKLLPKDISKYLNISTITYSFYEQGKQIPDNETLELLAVFYDVSIDYLLGRTDILNSERLLTPDQQLAALLNDPTLKVAFQDYASWTDEDKIELVNYLKAKRIARENKDK